MYLFRFIILVLFFTQNLFSFHNLDACSFKVHKKQNQWTLTIALNKNLGDFLIKEDSEEIERDIHSYFKKKINLSLDNQKNIDLKFIHSSINDDKIILEYALVDFHTQFKTLFIAPELPKELHQIWAFTINYKTKRFLIDKKETTLTLKYDRNIGLHN